MEELEAQIMELDALQSIYSGPGELELDNPETVADIRSMVEQIQQHQLPTDIEELNNLGSIGLILHLSTELKHKLDIMITLPTSYPIAAPQVSVRSSDWSRTQHSLFTDVLSSAVRDEIHRVGVQCLHDVICWVLDKADHYMTESPSEISKSHRVKSCNAPSRTGPRFSRLWIYSHHIYNLTKRKMIVDNARDLDLTGFCVPGKPGIICVEGDTDNADEFWNRIKSMTWQRITLRHREDGRKADRRFEGFEEKGFDIKQVKGRGAHADMGEVYQFLQQRGCVEVFKMYFGLEGKAESKDSNLDSTDG